LKRIGRLTKNGCAGTLPQQVEKGLAGIGVPHNRRRLITRVICRGFFMVRRMGAPSGAPFLRAVTPTLCVWPPEIGVSRGWF